MTESEMIALGKLLESTGYNGTFDARYTIWHKAKVEDPGKGSRLWGITEHGPYYWAIAAVYLGDL